MTLYDKAECPFCWKVRLALHELDIDAEVIDYLEPETRDRWQALTPKKTVPVMVTDSGVIYESNVILEYLAEVSDRLLPNDRESRIRARLINAYSDSAIGAGLREVIFEKRGKPEQGWNMARIESGIETFERALTYLSDQLGDREYFSSIYSFPEAALTARFGLAEAYGVSIPERFSNLQRWFDRIKARASYPATAPQQLIA